MRVLLVTLTLGLGGSERQMALLARELRRRQLEVKVFAFEADGPWLAQLQAWDVPVIPGRLGPSSAKRALRPFRIARAAVRLAATMLKFRPAVVHAYLPLANFVTSIVGTALRVPGVIISRRGLGTYRDAYPWWNRFDRLAYRLSDFTVCNSEAVLEDSARRDGLGRSKYRVIYNGIESIEGPLATRSKDEIRTLIGLSDRDTAIVTVANLIPYKGHEELLAAFQTVARAHPEARLVLAGEGRDNWKQQLERLAADLGIASKVIFLGRWTDVPALLRAMDMAVISSREEGFSNALLEALEAGIPVVATDVGGNREALEGGRFGLLVRPRDATALAEGIDTMLRNLRHWRAVASEAPRWVRERFSIETMADAHVRLYAYATGTTPPSIERSRGR